MIYFKAALRTLWDILLVLIIILLIAGVCYLIITRPDFIFFVFMSCVCLYYSLYIGFHLYEYITEEIPSIFYKNVQKYKDKNENKSKINSSS